MYLQMEWGSGIVTQLVPSTVAVLIQPETPSWMWRKGLGLLHWFPCHIPLYMIWAQSDSLRMCDSGSLCSAGISPAPEMGDLAFPFSFLLFCLPSRLCWSFNAVNSWIFFVEYPAFASWHWSAVIPESSSDLFFSSLNISVFSVYQRQMMLSCVLLFLLHVCWLEQKSKAAIWPKKRCLNLLPFFISAYQRRGNSLTFTSGLILYCSYLFQSCHPQEQLSVLFTPLKQREMHQHSFDVLRGRIFISFTSLHLRIVFCYVNVAYLYNVRSSLVLSSNLHNIFFRSYEMYNVYQSWKLCKQVQTVKGRRECEWNTGNLEGLETWNTSKHIKTGEH